MTSTVTVETTEEILSLSDEAFRELVDIDVRSKEPNVFLRDPLVVSRWYHHLVISKRSIEGQFGAERKRIASLIFQVEDDPDNDDLLDRLRKERIRYCTWKASALRFNSGLEMRIREAHSLLPRVDLTYLEKEISVLRSSIRAHRDSFDQEVDEPSSADLDLWNLIN